MENVNLGQSSFSAGELAPTLIGRDDVQQYAFGAAKMRNVLATPHGGFKRCPGLRFDEELQRANYDTWTATSAGSGQVINYTSGLDSNHFTTGHFTTASEIFIVRQRKDFPTVYKGYAILNPGVGGDDGFTLSGDNITITGNMEIGDKIYVVSNKSLALGTDPETYSTTFTEDILEDSENGISVFPFAFSISQQYCVVLTNFLFSVYKKDGDTYTLQRRLAAPYFGDDLQHVTFAQSLDAIVFFHKYHVPLQFLRSGSDTTWVRTWWATTNIPEYDFDDEYSPGGTHVTAPSSVAEDHVERIRFAFGSGSTQKYTIFVNGEETEEINFDGSGGGTHIADNVSALQSAIEDLQNVGTGNCVVAHDSDDKYNITMQGDAAGKEWDFESGKETFSGASNTLRFITKNKGQGEIEIIWSERRGWPRCGTFFGGRLYFCGFLSIPHWIASSRPTDLSDFNTELSLADYGFVYALESNQVASIFGVYGGKHLTFFTSGAEFYVPKSIDTAPDPENFFVRQTTTRGAKEGVPQVEVQGGLVFVDRFGKSIQEIIYEETSKSYNSTSITTLAPHLINDPVDMAFHSSSSSDDADYLYVVNSDGTLAVFNSLRNEGINAWTLRSTEGDFRACAVVDTDAVFAVRRTIDGVDKFFLEHFDDSLFMDSATDGLSGASSTSGLAHLTGELCDLLLDGTLQDQVTAAATTNFGSTSDTSWQAGLRFPDVSDDNSGFVTWVKMMPVQLGPENRSLRGGRQGIVDVFFNLYQTSSLGVRVESGTAYDLPFRELGEVLGEGVPVYTGDKEIRGLQGWSDGAQLSIYQKDSLPMRVLSVTPEVAV